MCPCVLSYLSILSFFIPESPKFFYAKGRFKELAAYINESVRQNGTNFKIEESVSLYDKYMSEKSDNLIIKAEQP